MGTHPIFESDFDCLTDVEGLGEQCSHHRHRFNVSLSLSACIQNPKDKIGCAKSEHFAVRDDGDDGAVLEWIYSFIFFLYIGPIRPRKNAVILIGAISFLTSVLLLVKVMEHKVAVQTLGMVASVVNIVTFASPLATLKEVVRTSNCSSFPPLPLQITMFVTPLLWFIYSQLIHDSFLAVPNFLGIILGIVQLGMRAKYPSRPADDYNRLDGVKM